MADYITTVPCPSCAGINRCPGCAIDACGGVSPKHVVCETCGGLELNLVDGLTVAQARAVADKLRTAIEPARPAGPRRRSLVPGRIAQPHRPGIELKPVNYIDDASSPLKRYRVMRIGTHVELAGDEAVLALAERVVELADDDKASRFVAGELLWRVKELTSACAILERRITEMQGLATDATRRAEELESALELERGVAGAVRSAEVSHG